MQVHWRQRTRSTLRGRPFYATPVFKRRRFGDLIDRQLELFANENRDALERVAEARRRELGAGREDATEAFGDYLDEVGWAAEELRALRDGFARTLEEPAARDYHRAYDKAVRRRFPALHDAFARDEDLEGEVDEED
jgi:hypothetical protein